MKKYILHIGLLLASAMAFGQLNIIPFAGMNSTKMYQSFGYQKGGSFAVAGMEIEWRKKPKAIKPLHLSMVTGISYLNNGYYKSERFSFIGVDFYDASVTDREMEYIQIPFVVRLNWQPFPLVEDWKVFFGAGISYNLLQSARLSEEYTSIFLSDDVFAPPPTEQYMDSQDVTDLGQDKSLFRRIDIGMTYRRIQIAVRFSVSITDLYYNGIESSWGIPAEYSEYLQAYAEEGEIKEKYSEITVGYRIFK